ncbi:MAG TPA: exonuclease SbcCD subunit D [Streptosporangiaceae bacterium]|jgi:exonuclease SbcD
MRLIHTSDWHLGRTLHGESLLEHQGTFLEWLLAQAVSQHADAVVVAGDVYDRAVPPADAVALLDFALTAFARQRIPMIITSGNHDSAVRLGFGSGLSEAAGIHLRTSVADSARPVVLTDAGGEVGIYGLPYLLPDAVMAELGAERSHESVLAAAAARIHADAASRGIGRVVIAAHAFVRGAAASESERDIRVGGIGDAPASVFGSACYVALGHLHGQQLVQPGAGAGAGAGRGDADGRGDDASATDGACRASGPTVRYCGSPLAFSFSEARHRKSVTVVDIDAAGQVTTTLLPAPVPRPLREARGRIADLLARADGDLADLAGAWVKVTLTDSVRPSAPMERLREKWPHTLVLDFAPEGGVVAPETDLRALAQASDPIEICGLFVEYAGGGPPDAAERQVLREVIETAQHDEAAA